MERGSTFTGEEIQLDPLGHLEVLALGDDGGGDNHLGIMEFLDGASATESHGGA